MSAVGMVSPVGAEAVQTFGSVRAGIRRIMEHPEIYYCLAEKPEFDPPEPLVASAVYHLDARARREGRMAEWLGLLAGRAFRDLEQRARLSPEEMAKTGVFLALPARDGFGPEYQDAFACHFHNHAERDLLPHLRMTFGGHAAALSLAEEAAALVQAGRLSRAIVGAVDSWLFTPWLEAADRDWRLLSARNADGFQPGEAAAFFLLEPANAAAKRGLAPLATVGGFTQGRFEAQDGLPNTGVELAAMIERLLDEQTAPLFVCDLNGQSARTREWAYAVSRLGRKLGKGFTLHHPASALGDVGTATGAVLIALAAQWVARSHPRRRTLVWAASDDGERRAIALDPP